MFLMKKLLVILLLLFPVHGAWAETGPHKHNEYITWEVENEKAYESINFKLHNNHEKKIVVVYEIHTLNANCDANSRMIYNVSKKIFPKSSGEIRVYPKVGFHNIACYSFRYTEKDNYFDKYDTKEIKPPPKEKTWLEKQKEKRKDKARAKDQCARKSGKAKTNRAADRIYRACMERKGY